MSADQAASASPGLATPTIGQRFSEMSWKVATSVVSAVLSAAAIYGLGQITGANDRILDDVDCQDFASQAQAQDAFAHQPGDPFKLDRDGDGRACE